MLCQTAIVYSRRIDETVFSFGHEGVLYRRSFVMYDKQTDSLWIHTTGECVKGPSKGKVLSFLPSTVTTWKRWKAQYPKTLVLTGRKAGGFMGRFGLKDDPSKYGISVGQGPTPSLVPFEALKKQGVMTIEHEGAKVAVFWDEQGGTARAFGCAGHVFTYADGKITDASARVWDPSRGTTTDSAGKVLRLEQVPGTIWLIERWTSFHPKGAVAGTQAKR